MSLFSFRDSKTIRLSDYKTISVTGKMPETACLAPVSRDHSSGSGFSNMSDHILSILTRMIDSLPAGRFEGLYVLFTCGFVTHIAG